MSNVWEELKDKTKQYYADRDIRIDCGDLYRAEKAAIDKKYYASIEALDEEYESKKRQLQKERDTALKNVDGTGYFDSLKREELSKSAVQIVASKIVNNYNISNADVCDMIEKSTGKKWKMLPIVGNKIYDIMSSRDLERVGLVCVSDEDEQYKNRVYRTTAGIYTNSNTATTKTCKVLLEAGVEDAGLYNDFIKDINWAAVYVDYKTRATDYQRLKNDIELTLDNVPGFRDVILSSIEHAFVNGKVSTRVAE